MSYKFVTTICFELKYLMADLIRIKAIEQSAPLLLNVSEA